MLVCCFFAKLYTDYQTAAFSHGPYVAHYALFPAEDQVALGQTSISSDASPEAHKELLQAYFQARSASYILKAQFSSSLTQHPVENAALVWPESTAPWFELATVTFPKQDSFSEARLEWWEDHIALTPFNGLEAHRPLGSINRLRKRVYEQVCISRSDFSKSGTEKSDTVPQRTSQAQWQRRRLP